MQSKRVAPVFWWFAWVGVQVWVLHPGVHTHSLAKGDAVGGVCLHHCCPHQPQAEGAGSEPSSPDSHCELCAANCEKEPIDVAVDPSRFLPPETYGDSECLSVGFHTLKKIVIVGRSLRGPPQLV